DCIGSMATHPNDCFLLLIFREFFEQFSYFRYFFFIIFYGMCLFLLLFLFFFVVFLLLKPFRFDLIVYIMLLVSFIFLGMILNTSLIFSDRHVFFSCRQVCSRPMTCYCLQIRL